MSVCCTSITSVWAVFYYWVVIYAVLIIFKCLSNLNSTMWVASFYTVLKNVVFHVELIFRENKTLFSSFWKCKEARILNKKCWILSRRLYMFHDSCLSKKQTNIYFFSETFLFLERVLELDINYNVSSLVMNSTSHYSSSKWSKITSAMN